MTEFKKFTIPSIVFVIYIILLWTVLFWSWSITNIWTTIGVQVLLFILLPFAYLGQSKKFLLQLSWIILIRWIMITVFTLLFLPFQYTVFLFLSHITLSIYTLWWFYLTWGSKKRYYRTSSQEWLWTVAIMLAITYTTTIWVAGTATKISCDDLHEQSTGVISQFFPTKFSNTKVADIAGQITLFWSKSVGQLLWLDNSKDKEIPRIWSISSWVISSVILQTWSMDNLVLYTGENILTWEVESTGWLLFTFLSYQNKQIHGLIENQTIINERVCDITLNQINTLANHNNAQIIVYVLLILLIYIPMKTITFIIGLINYLIILFLFKTKRFKKKYHEEKVERIEY